MVEYTVTDVNKVSKAVTAATFNIDEHGTLRFYATPFERKSIVVFMANAWQEVRKDDDVLANNRRG